MPLLPLRFDGGHLFVTVGDHDWLVDTGAPTSFGDVPVDIGERNFQIPDSYGELTAATLSEFVGHQTAGIIGADILANFDTSFDVPNGQIVFTDAQLEMVGDVIETDEFMGIPIIQAAIDGAQRRMFFDTGAQLSYFQGDSLTSFPAAGVVTDFYPGVGQFQTETYFVDVTIGNSGYTLRFGSLPGLLGMTLMMAKTEGIIGNAILQNRVVGFFPRRHMVVLA